MVPSSLRGFIGIALIGVVLAFTLAWYQKAHAQTEEGPQPTTESATPDDGSTDPAIAPTAPALGKGLNLFELLISGGGFMIPLVGLSVFVIAVTVERAIAVRGARVVPKELVKEIGELGQAAGGFDPRKAYRICQSYPSACSKVLQAMLTKVGRPQSEIEHCVQEASQREAERLHENVRWLSLAAGVAPLIGLLGTVWGMILAFHQTTQLVVGQNKAQALAEGIYTALVTTLYGLCIAIPAVMAVHFFESRIVKMFHEIDELAFNLFPQVEKFEGKVRFSKQEDA